MALLLPFFSCYEEGKRGNSAGIVSGAAGNEEISLDRASVAVLKKDVPLPQAKKKWTVLVYMDGDNNLSPFSSLDIEEMIKTGSGDNMNIVVLWDNDPSQDSGASSRHGYYYIEKGGVVLLKDTGEVNMGSAATAKKFIDYAIKNFSAEHYMWVYWNHGGAVDRRSRGISWDDTNGGDHLTETEQKGIADYFVKKAGKKIDILGFDACLMATAEIAYQYKNTADYLVASEETIPGKGWDYNFLSKIKTTPSISPVNLAKQVLAYYKKFYTPTGDGGSATLSVMDLAHAGDLARAIDDFSLAAMKSGVSGAEFKKISQGLPMFGAYSSGTKKYYFTRDLYEYFEKASVLSSLPKSVKDKAKRAMSVIKSSGLVAGEWHGSDWSGRAQGVAMTFKYATKVYRELELCKDTSWDEFLNWAGFPDSDAAY